MPPRALWHYITTGGFLSQSVGISPGKCRGNVTNKQHLLPLLCVNAVPVLEGVESLAQPSQESWSFTACLEQQEEPTDELFNSQPHEQAIQKAAMA